MRYHSPQSPSCFFPSSHSEGHNTRLWDPCSERNLYPKLFIPFRDHNRCKVVFPLLTFYPEGLDFTYYSSNSPGIPDLALSIETMDDGVCKNRRKQLYHNTANTHTNFYASNVLHECYGLLIPSWRLTITTKIFKLSNMPCPVHLASLLWCGEHSTGCENPCSTTRTHRSHIKIP